MEKRVRLNKKGVLPVWILFFSGFLIGVLIPNTIWRLEWHQKTAASIYLLGTFADKSMEGNRYLWHVLRVRGGYFLLTVLCGFSVFGVPLAVLGILFLGLEIGMILTLSILQFGLAGGAVGVCLFLPQYLLYLPAIFFLMSLVYGQSVEIWKNRGIFPQRIRKYMLGVFLTGLAYAGGILLEVYCNPWVTEMLIKGLKIF